MIPSSFCTICTSTCVNELKGFLMSLSLFHLNERIYILCDTITKDIINKFMINQPIKLEIIWIANLDKYTKFNRTTMERLDIWSDFQMSKSIVIDKALEREKDTLFLDCDIIILNKIDDILEGDYDIGVSPGFVNKQTEEKYGKYNGGMLWVKNKQVPEKWREFTKKSRYYDQASIEDLVKHFNSFEFGDNYNLQTWRFIVGEEHATNIMSYIFPKNGYIMYKNKPLKFIHTHFNTQYFANINQYFKNIIRESNMKKVLKCIEEVEK